MKTFASLKPEFVLTSEDIATFEKLTVSKPNLPETKLTGKEREFINHLYHKHITKIDNLDWSPSLVSIEQREKWPSGHKVKTHEAQRMVLDWLVYLNRKGPMTAEDFAKHCFYMLTSRPASLRLVAKVYNINNN